MFPLAYLQWSESLGRVEEELLDAYVSREELFLRKLVNASVVRNRLLEHTSNESENDRRHAVYAKPYEDGDMPEYGPAVRKHVFDACDMAFRPEAVFFVWENGDFKARKLAFDSANAMEIAQLLLDHYVVERGTTYEVLYTVYDHERKKALFFLKERFE